MRFWDHQNYFIIILICLVAFSFYFASDRIIGTDSYFFLSGICKGTDLTNESFLTKFIFSVLPCNQFYLKTIMLSLLISASIGVALIGSVFNKKYGWLAGIFVFLAPVWSTYFYYLENDQFAFPLLIFGLYFVLKGWKEKNNGNKFIGIGLILIAGTIWQGAIFYIMGVSLLWIYTFPVFITFLIFFKEKLFNTLFPNNAIAESAVILGVIDIFILIPALAFTEIFLLPLMIWFIALGIINVKFIIHAVPLLAVCFVNLFLKIKEPYNFLLIFFAFSMAFSVSLYSYQIHPTTQDFQAIEYGVQEAKDMNKPFMNSWDYGYWVNWLGGKASATTSPKTQDFNNAITLDYNGLDCKKLKQFGEVYIYEC